MKGRTKRPKFQFTLPPDLREALERRGAQSDRTHGPQGYASQFALTFGLLGSALVRSDPRETRHWADDFYERILDAIPEPQSLGHGEIAKLGSSMESAYSKFRQIAEALRIPASDLVSLLNDLSFAEKVHLVDAATARQAQSAIQTRKTKS